MVQAVPQKLTSREIRYPTDPADKTQVSFIEVINVVLNVVLLSSYKFDNEVQKYLSKNSDVLLSITDIIEKVNSVLPKPSMPEFEVIEDEEILDDRRLGIIFKIQDKPYEDILKMWNDVSSKAYQNVNNSISKKIAIILSR